MDIALYNITILDTGQSLTIVLKRFSVFAIQSLPRKSFAFLTRANCGQSPRNERMKKVVINSRTVK